MTERLPDLHAAILRRLAQIKSAPVAAAIGHDESHISRVASGERGIRISELQAFLAALGFEVVETGGNSVTLPREKLRALKVLARDALNFMDEEAR